MTVLHATVPGDVVDNWTVQTAQEASVGVACPGDVFGVDVEPQV